MGAQKLSLDLCLSAPPAAATAPTEYRFMRRDEVRMMVLHRETGLTRHVPFFQLPNYLDHGDVVVVNTSATIPGRLYARANGEPLFLHLATKLSESEYIVERRTSTGGPDRRSFSVDDVVDIYHPNTGMTEATVIVKRRFHSNSRLWLVQTTTNLFALAERIGVPIRYSYVPREYDTSMYQTLFARTPGSAEMPSAGRPFTMDVLRNIASKGVKVRSLLLHTGVSSHEVENDLAHHPVLPEWFEVPQATASAVNQAIQEGRRVIAVGTTVVRALESAALADGVVRAGSDWTTHLVTPDTPPQVVTGIVTGMHDSGSSHLAMMYAFIRPSYLRRAYEEAVACGYLWHEFGDVSLIV